MSTETIKNTITNEEVIASVLKAFVIDRGPPGIDLETGKTVYPLTTTEKQGAGCAVYHIVKANKSFIDKLDKVGTHEKCRACDLSEAGIELSEILTPAAYDHLANVAYKKNLQGYQYFFEDIQQAHDNAAINYYRRCRLDQTHDEATARSMFADELTHGLRTVCDRWDIEYNDCLDIAEGEAPPPTALSDNPDVLTEDDDDSDND